MVHLKEQIDICEVYLCPFVQVWVRWEVLYLSAAYEAGPEKQSADDRFKDTSFSSTLAAYICLFRLVTKRSEKKNPQVVVLHGLLINQTWYKVLISEIWKVLATRLLTFCHSRCCYLLLPVFKVNWANCPPAVGSYLAYGLIQSLLCNKGNKQISIHFRSLNRTSLH